MQVRKRVPIGVDGPAEKIPTGGAPGDGTDESGLYSDAEAGPNEDEHGGVGDDSRNSESFVEEYVGMSFFGMCLLVIN